MAPTLEINKKAGHVDQLKERALLVKELDSNTG